MTRKQAERKCSITREWWSGSRRERKSTRGIREPKQFFFLFRKNKRKWTPFLCGLSLRWRWKRKGESFLLLAAVGGDDDGGGRRLSRALIVLWRLKYLSFFFWKGTILAIPVRMDCQVFFGRFCLLTKLFSHAVWRRRNCVTISRVHCVAVTLFGLSVSSRRLTASPPAPDFEIWLAR